MMNIIEREFPQSRTWDLVEQMLAPDGEDIVYVAPFPMLAEKARKLALEATNGDEHRFPPERFVTVEDIRATPRSERDRPRYVVEAFDVVLGMLLGGRPVSGVVLTSSAKQEALA